MSRILLLLLDIRSLWLGSTSLATNIFNLFILLLYRELQRKEKLNEYIISYIMSQLGGEKSIKLYQIMTFLEISTTPVEINRPGQLT